MPRGHNKKRQPSTATPPIRFTDRTDPTITSASFEQRIELSQLIHAISTNYQVCKQFMAIVSALFLQLPVLNTWYEMPVQAGLLPDLPLDGYTEEDLSSESPVTMIRTLVPRALIASVSSFGLAPYFERFINKWLLPNIVVNTDPLAKDLTFAKAERRIDTLRNILKRSDEYASYTKNFLRFFPWVVIHFVYGTYLLESSLFFAMLFLLIKIASAFNIINLTLMPVRIIRQSNEQSLSNAKIALFKALITDVMQNINIINVAFFDSQSADTQSLDYILRDYIAFGFNFKPSNIEYFLLVKYSLSRKNLKLPNPLLLEVISYNFSSIISGKFSILMGNSKNMAFSFDSKSLANADIEKTENLDRIKNHFKKINSDYIFFLDFKKDIYDGTKSASSNSKIHYYFDNGQLFIKITHSPDILLAQFRETTLQNVKIIDGHNLCLAISEDFKATYRASFANFLAHKVDKTEAPASDSCVSSTSPMTSSRGETSTSSSYANTVTADRHDSQALLSPPVLAPRMFASASTVFSGASSSTAPYRSTSSATSSSSSSPSSSMPAELPQPLPQKSVKRHPSFWIKQKVAAPKPSVDDVTLSAITPELKRYKLYPIPRSNKSEIMQYGILSIPYHMDCYKKFKHILMHASAKTGAKGSSIGLLPASKAKQYGLSDDCQWYELHTSSDTRVLGYVAEKQETSQGNISIINFCVLATHVHSRARLEDYDPLRHATSLQLRR